MKPKRTKDAASVLGTAGYLDPGCRSGEGMESALLNVAWFRYMAFIDRFGRDPGPDEPLLFDPGHDEPVAASPSDMVRQVMAAAAVTDVDAVSVLDFLGFK